MIRTLICLSFISIIMSCDVIEGPVTTEVGPIDTSTSSFTKAVLLVEFTGHKCGFCPAAGETAAQLKSAYGSRVVVVAIHSGDLARPSPPAAGKFYLDFRTDAGTAIDSEFGASISGLPTGLVNLLEFSGEQLVKNEAWPGIVDQLLQEAELPYGLDAAATINGSNVELTASCEFGEPISGKYNLGAYLTEDSIIAWQKDYTLPPGQTDIENFEHKHVFRGNFYFPGSPSVIKWGSPLSKEEFIKGDVESLDLEIELLSDYNQDHLNVVLFLFDQESGTILQTKEFQLADIL